MFLGRTFDLTPFFERAEKNPVNKKCLARKEVSHDNSLDEGNIYEKKHEDFV